MFKSDHEIDRRSLDQDHYLHRGSGAVYTRWGRTSCDEEAKLVDAGQILLNVFLLLLLLFLNKPGYRL